jgi:hypothetical protein
MEQRLLWKFFWINRYMGVVEGLFVATESEIKEAMGKEIFFGEILAQHGNVSLVLSDDEIIRVDVDAETVEKVTEALEDDTWSGYNPLRYIKIEQE